MADAGTTAAAAAQTASPELWASMLKSFGMLLLVLAVLILVLWLLRRYFTHPGAAGQQGGVIRMIASMYVAPKERIALVDVLGEKLLIGITPQQISFLARIEDEKEICEARLAENASPGFFKTLLKRKLGGAGTDPETKEDAH